MSIGKMDGGTWESHAETRRQRLHLHLQLRRGQLHTGKRVGTRDNLHHLRNGGDFVFLEGIPENRREVQTDTHSEYTSVQYSLFTSEERAPRAWLKSSQIAFHLCALESRFVIWFDSCLTLCCSLTCRIPRAHHLLHWLFLLPRHKNTQYNRDNMINSENAQNITHISKLS